MGSNYNPHTKSLTKVSMEVIVTSLVRFVYKLFTGRIQPTSMGVIVQLQPVTSKDIPVNPTFKGTTGPSGGVPASCSMSYWLQIHLLILFF